MQAKEEEGKMQKELQALVKKQGKIEEDNRLLTFQIERLRKINKKNDSSQKESTKVKELTDQLTKLKNENDLLNELLRSLKAERNSKRHK